MNIVVIVSDTYRYDYIGANGNDWIKTPELDAFAEKGVSFDNYYVSSFPTIPTRTDWFTGTYGFPFYGWKPLDPSVPVMATLLAREGYVNQLIVDTPHMMKATAHFDRGFHGAMWVRGQEGDTPLTWMNDPIQHRTPEEKTRTRPKPFGNVLANVHAWQNHRGWESGEDRFVAKTCRAASKWVEHNYKAEKFFLWVDCFDVHEPWDPPEYLVEMYDDSGYDGPPMFHPNYGPASDYTPEELSNLRAHYAGEATLVSQHVGRLLRTLEDTGAMERTAVFFMADHGMYLGEHNRTGKSNISENDDRGSWPLYREVSHIPLIAYMPGAEGGRRVSQLVQPPDILPTVCELTGTAPPERMDGHSLLPLIRGEEVDWQRQLAVSSAGKLSITDGSWSLILGRNGEIAPELYDLAADPGESNNVAADCPAMVKNMRNGCAQFLRSLGADKERVRALYAQ